MTLKEFLNTNKLQIRIVYPDEYNKYYANIQGCVVKNNVDDRFVMGIVGRGNTAEAAIIDFLQETRGKILKNVYKNTYIPVPEDIYLEEKTSIPDSKYSDIWKEINKLRDEILRIKTKTW